MSRLKYATSPLTPMATLPRYCPRYNMYGSYFTKYLIILPNSCYFQMLQNTRRWSQTATKHILTKTHAMFGYNMHAKNVIVEYKGILYAKF